MSQTYGKNHKSILNRKSNEFETISKLNPAVKDPQYPHNAPIEAHQVYFCVHFRSLSAYALYGSLNQKFRTRKKQ